MLQEIIWREEGQVPLLHDHLKFSTISTLYWALACISFVDHRMDANDDVSIFCWAISSPKIIENSAMIARLMDDISGHEVNTHLTLLYIHKCKLPQKYS